MRDSSTIYRATDTSVSLGQLDVSVRDAGAGDAIVLLHGFPHTKELWRDVEPLLVSAGYRVIAPDLRGTGASGRAADGYDADTLADDQVGLLDVLGVASAHVVGFDFGAAPAFALAARQHTRVRSLTIVEAVIGGLAGAENFLAAGGPWWFGFHQVPGLAEDVIGHEDRYIRFFLDIGSARGVPGDLAERFVEAYSGRDSLRSAFEHYRAISVNAVANAEWATAGRLRMPVSAVGAAAVTDVPARQLSTVCDDVQAFQLDDCGHIVPIDAPRRLTDIVLATVRRAHPTGPRTS